MLHDILVIEIRGTVDQPGLNRLRAELDLKKFGRLSDDQDQQFGYRKIDRPNGQYGKIVLYREDDGSWQLELLGTDQFQPSVNEVASLQVDLLERIVAAGFQPTLRAKPANGSTT